MRIWAGAQGPGAWHEPRPGDRVLAAREQLRLSAMIVRPANACLSPIPSPVLAGTHAGPMDYTRASVWRTNSEGAAIALAQAEDQRYVNDMGGDVPEFRPSSALANGARGAEPKWA